MVTHPDPDALLDAALAADLEVEDHARGCTTCRHELDELRSLVLVARDPAEPPVRTPPAHVWDAVAAELRDDLRDLGGAAPPAVDDDAPAPVVAHPTRRRRERRAGTGRRQVWPLAAAVAAVLVVGAGAVGFVVGSRDATGAELGSATLLALDSGAEHGVARVSEVGDRRVLQVTTDGLAQPSEGFLEVWLLDESASRLVPLGVLDASTGSFAVPAGVDLAEFPVVDISDEPLDGDPAHSGDSLVRGTIQG